MSLGACIPGMIERGEIDKQRGKRMAALFDELEKQYRQSMGPEAAAAEASEATLRQLAAEAKQKRRQTLLQVARQRDAMKEIGRFKSSNPYAAVTALLVDDEWAPYRRGNVSTAAKRIEAQAHRDISAFIERHRRGWLGRPRLMDGLRDVVRELHGQPTGDDMSAAMAKGIAETFDALRRRFNAAGGATGKLEGFGLPHRHDPMRVRAVPQDEWVSFTAAQLDRAKMIDRATGAPMTDARLSETLGKVYETIRTNGLTGEASAALTGPGKLGNQHAEHRFLHFKDGDAWLAYDERFGSGDTPFSTIIAHISGMAKDIATMERLGPNPDATVRYLLDHVDKSRAQSDRPIVGAVMGKARGRQSTEDIWRYVKGETSIPVVPESKLGFAALRTSQGIRNWSVAAKLGSATISAATDIGWGAIARLYYGMPMWRTFEGYFAQATSAERRQLAVQLGGTLEDAAHSLHSLARLYGEASGPGWTQWLADSSMRVSLLNTLTEMGQRAAHVEVMGTLGAMRERSWDALPPRLRAAMERNGLDKFDWQAIRLSEPVMAGNAAYVDPRAIGDRAVSERLMDMALRFRSVAVPEPDARARAIVTGGTKPGTLTGEALRHGFQFKGFSVGLFLKLHQIMSVLPPRDRALVLSNIAIGMTLMGAGLLQIDELRKGRDPIPADTPDFWKRAFLRGGGLGVVGDLIGVAVNPRVDSLGEFAMGPTASLSKDIKRAYDQASPGDPRVDGTRRDGDPAGAFIELARKQTPVASSLWYAGLATNRIVFDQANAHWGIDPNLDAGRAIGTARKAGTDFWWKPGEIMPSRAPDFSNVVGHAERAEP